MNTNQCDNIMTKYQLKDKKSQESLVSFTSSRLHIVTSIALSFSALIHSCNEPRCPLARTPHTHLALPIVWFVPMHPSVLVSLLNIVVISACLCTMLWSASCLSLTRWPLTALQPSLSDVRVLGRCTSSGVAGVHRLLGAWDKELRRYKLLQVIIT